MEEPAADDRAEHAAEREPGYEAHDHFAHGSRPRKYTINARKPTKEPTKEPTIVHPRDSHASSLNDALPDSPEEPAVRAVRAEGTAAPAAD